MKVKFKNKFSNIGLWGMLLIPILYFVIFKYIPILGIALAFKDFNVFQGILESPWVGFKHFSEMFAAKEFYVALKNTLFLNLLQVLLGFPVPIITAILLNELVGERLKKFTQTVIYLPNFLSWVIISGMVYEILSPRGLVNSSLVNMGIKQIPFLTDTTLWRFVYFGSGVWQGFGYGTILYLAAMAGVNTELYEAAYIDGAGRFKRIWHVTLPQIRGTIMIKFIMDIGKILNISFEQPFLLGNVLVKDASNVISTYVYNVGLQAGRYDFATAVGVFQSLVGLVLVLLVNHMAKKMGEEGIV